MLANIGYIQNQVGKKLMLHFQAPVVDHSGAAVSRVDILWPREIQLGRIKVGRRCERRKPSRKTERGRESVKRKESWVTLESRAIETTEIRIDQGTIENPESSAEDGLPVESGRRPGEPQPWSKILEPRIGPVLIHVAVPPRSLAGKYQGSRDASGPGIWSGKTDVRSVAMHFATRNIDIPPQSIIDDESRHDLVTILNKKTVVGRNVFRLAGVSGQVGVVYQPQQQAGCRTARRATYSNIHAGRLLPPKVERPRAVVSVN